MLTITNDLEYQTALQTIQTLLAKGSQAITTEEISFITKLRHQASAYEKIKYDHSIPQALQST
ncbi:hypothetical protein [Pedobacter aquatilis]|uniref:hypothetical protein n=1 Tax=Pedobacter aquatilis TaxID=351343 RepID=UPI00292FF1EC|nr:hypothetical protein [Pedobacter aquatilis]